MTTKLQRIVLATAMVVTLQAANAAERLDAERVVACADERDDARRLACYDDAVAAAKRSGAPVSPAPAPAMNSKNEFGVTGSAVARQRSDEQQEQTRDKEAIESLTAVVTAVWSKPHGELVITLDNGQVWAQKRKERYFAAKPGDKVTIDAGMLGSYRMIIGNRSTHVTRLK
ncbi:MAG TPA: hypothetical protein VGD45_16650 [Steroidobacter sp.]|uniref:hypothetical protein n=1 Tax=Steroidobacter sp. TaxID=1978227 RepID=UPI002EDB6BCE